MRDVGISLNKLGDVAKAMGDRGTAERYFAESISWREKRMRGDTSNNEFKRDGYVAYVKFAKLALSDLSRQDVDKAISDAVEIAEELVVVDPRNLHWHEDLIRAYLLACRRSSQRGDEASLITLMERALCSLEHIDVRDDLSGSGNANKEWGKLFMEVSAANQFRAARKACRVGRMLAMKHASCVPEAPDVLAVVLFWNELSANLERDHGEPAGALPYVQDAFHAAKKRLELNIGDKDHLRDAIKLGCRIIETLTLSDDTFTKDESALMRAQMVLTEMDNLVHRVWRMNTDGHQPTIDRAWVRIQEGNIKGVSGDPDGAKACFAQALDLVRDLDDPDARHIVEILQDEDC